MANGKWQTANGKRQTANGMTNEKITVLTLLMIAVFCLAAATAEPVPFKVLQSGGYSGIEEHREVVIRNAKEWSALQLEPSPQGTPAPAVDFTKSMVIGVFLGTRPTGGHAVAIDRIERDGDDLLVTYRERRPGPNDIASQVITTPFQLVTTAAFAGRVRFTRAR